MFHRIVIRVAVFMLVLVSFPFGSKALAFPPTPLDGKIAYTVDPNTLHVLNGITGVDSVVPGIDLTLVERPQWSSDGQWLTFTGHNAGDNQVYVSRTDGSGFRMVTPGSGNLQTPSFSPDTTEITYFSSPYGNIFTINFDGTNRVDRGASGEPTRWSPDGNRIAYSNWARPTYDSDIFVYNLGSGTSTQLTPHVVGRAFYDSGWSPDGTKIALSGHTEGQWDIWTMTIGDPDSLVNLTPDWTTSNEESPSWSPDGKYIVFKSNRNDDGTVGNNLDIWYMLANGSGRFDITKTPSINENFPAMGVPEPATLSLLALGGLALIRRRRK